MLKTGFSSILIFLFLLVLSYSCEKEEKKDRPSVTSSQVTNITTHSALSGGIIKNDGGASIIACGVIWDTLPGPDIQKSLTNDSLVDDSFISKITGLQSGTKYYIRAYATNSEGTAYGEELNFITLAEYKPVVKTLVARFITKTSAVAGGEILDSGMQMIITKGVCWQTSANPSVDDFLTDEGPGSKDYLSNLTGLTPGITYYYRAYAVNKTGTGYGDVKSFTTHPLGVPTVTTIEVSSVAYTFAISGGEIPDTGDSDVLDKGVCWNTSPNPTINDNITQDGQGADTYTSLLTGLSPGTTYYYRAYATNSIGTGYGEELSFQTVAIPSPDIITDHATNITPTSAICSGSATSDTINAIQSKGICYSLTPNPSISDLITDEGAGSGAFSDMITGLSPGTTYFIRAYAITAYGTYYGNEKSFTTKLFGIPVVKTIEVSSVTYTSAISGGEITDTGYTNILDKGVCWNVTPNPTIDNYLTNDGQGADAFVSTLAGLSPGTTYYYRAYATNSIGTGYGEELNFQTVAIPSPDIITNDATNITPTTATCSGSASSDTINAIQSKGICYSLTANPSTSDLITDEGAGSGSFSSLITGLLPGTTYFTRAYAITAYGTYYGNEKSFTTKIFSIPVVKTIEVSSVTYTSAISGGEISDTGYANILDKGVCWDVSPNPTIDDHLTHDGQGADAFVSALAGLLPGTTYYYRAYATNSIGIGYGEELSFQTSPVPPPDIITNDATNITATSAVCPGSASSDPINPILAKGICYSLTTNPSVTDLITDEGAGSGSFSSPIAGLLPGTTYFIRAYAITAYDTYYGNEKSFTTNDTLPEVETVEITVIKALCSIAAGSVLTDGGDPVTSRGFCWSESTGPTLSDLVITSGTGIGDFTGVLNGLNPSTTYYVRSFATNSVGTVYGNELTFITKGAADWVLAFSDDFESYTTGTHPSEDWVIRFDGDKGIISEDVAYEGVKSFMLSSERNWARVEAIPLDNVPDFIIFEGSIYVNQADKGCAIGFGYKESATTYRNVNSVNFNNNGKIAFGGELQDWTPQMWYKIKVECDYSTLKGKIWINDILMGSDIDLADKTKIKDFMIMGLNFPSGSNSKAYFDNIKVFVKGIDQPTCD